ncbi:hypothetical protein OVA10_25415 [Lelliottia sp. SL45]|uniref:hypothetical protein n=1 Tax=Lelliottia sp. SL45 TaxID=2994665 RepID=UPI002273DC15|nr:hypothetical protein [Lelliottia sp. SL45]MCY1696641.1 hypothetical protein [Lelliottia sp. SL45]MCY1701339.1 hypothetical protein [Lelliottia sp. SL45]
MKEDKTQVDRLHEALDITLDRRRNGRSVYIDGDLVTKIEELLEIDREKREALGVDSPSVGHFVRRLVRNALKGEK